MAARFKCKEYVFAATNVPVKLTTILGLSNADYIGTLVMRAGTGNLQDLFWGGSDVTTTTNRGGFLSAEDAIGIDVVNKFFGTDEVYLVGTINDIVHITWIQ